jgi:RND superfamily putative drug exporter
MVWIFQDGHLLGLLNSEASGFLVAQVPILIFCMAFGMSMDYEVFLLSRIHEEWQDAPGTSADNDRAVQQGVAKSGRIVSAAAAFMLVVFSGLTTSRVTLVQMSGLGLALFVIIDAVLIRALLLPALMHIGGRANWWQPVRSKRDRRR